MRIMPKKMNSAISNLKKEAKKRENQKKELAVAIF